MLFLVSNLSNAITIGTNAESENLNSDEFYGNIISKETMTPKHQYDLEKVIEFQSSWNSRQYATIVDNNGDVGYGIDMEMDSSGLCHISYSSFLCCEDTVRYAKQLENGSWDIQVVEQLNIERIITSLALDSDNRPHITYLDWGNKQLKYATLSEERGWQIEIVDKAVGNINYLYSTSIALDQQGFPHITYYDKLTNSIMHVYKISPTQWISEVVDA
ncbi:unnamed protein product, partial [marine sediment metagenome]